jgi:hypothetical protein
VDSGVSQDCHSFEVLESEVEGRLLFETLLTTWPATQHHIRQDLNPQI